MKFQLFLAVMRLSLVVCCSTLPISAQIVSTRSLPYGAATNGGGSPVITADSLGNAYLSDAFFNGTNYDFFTIKVDAAGDLVWSNLFELTSASDDVPLAIAADNVGNVYVTGYSDGGRVVSTIKFNASGRQEWLATYIPDGRGIQRNLSLILDKDGNAVVAGYNQTTNFFEDYAYFIVKYDSSGNGAWTNLVTGIGGEDVKVGIGVDQIGNIYVAGYAEFVEWQPSVFIIKYSPSGEIFWTNRVDGSYMESMNVDGFGNTYVGGYDYVTKCNANGDIAWTRMFPGNASAIGVDRLGNIIVSGAYWGSYWDTLLTIVKYNSDGCALWTNGAGNLDDNSLRNFAVDDSGNIYIVFNSTGVNDWGDSLRSSSIVGFLPDGTGKWAYSHNGTLSGLAVDAGGNVFVGKNDYYDDTLKLFEYTQKYSPPLSIAPDGDNLLLSWPALATNVVLECSSEFLSNPSWQEISNAPVTIGGRRVVTYPPSAGPQFFRLRAKE